MLAGMKKFQVQNLMWFAGNLGIRIFHEFSRARLPVEVENAATVFTIDLFKFNRK